MTLQEQRAKAIYNFMQKFIAKAKKHNAVFMVDGEIFKVEDILLTETSLQLKLSLTSTTTFFSIEKGWNSMLYDSVDEIKKYLKDRFKLYKEIR